MIHLSNHHLGLGFLFTAAQSVTTNTIWDACKMDLNKSLKQNKGKKKNRQLIEGLCFSALASSPEMKTNIYNPKFSSLQKQ